MNRNKTFCSVDDHHTIFMFFNDLQNECSICHFLFTCLHVSASLMDASSCYRLLYFLKETEVRDIILHYIAIRFQRMVLTPGRTGTKLLHCVVIIFDRISQNSPMWHHYSLLQDIILVLGRYGCGSP